MINVLVKQLAFLTTNHLCQNMQNISISLNGIQSSHAFFVSPKKYLFILLCAQINILCPWVNTVTESSLKLDWIIFCRQGSFLPPPKCWSGVWLQISVAKPGDTCRARQQDTWPGMTRARAGEKMWLHWGRRKKRRRIYLFNDQTILRQLSFTDSPLNRCTFYAFMAFTEVHGCLGKNIEK